MAERKKLLNDPQYLFVMLTAIVKKYGGEITITKSDLSCVTKSDMVSLSVNPKTQDIILKAVTLGSLDAGDDVN
jgi:hypothetical protein